MAAHESPRPEEKSHRPLGDHDIMALDLEIRSDHGECPVCREPPYNRTPTVFTKSTCIEDAKYHPGDRVEVRLPNNPEKQTSFCGECWRRSNNKQWFLDGDSRYRGHPDFCGGAGEGGPCEDCKPKWYPAEYHHNTFEAGDPYPAGEKEHSIVYYDSERGMSRQVEVSERDILKREVRRTCRHICCEACANSIVLSHSRGSAGVTREGYYDGTNPECPECRAPFSSCMAIPDLFTDSEAWFATVDFDKDNRLTKREITDVLKKYFNDTKALEEHLEEYWKKSPKYWDQDGNDAICYSEFNESLLPFLKTTHKALGDMKDYSAIPDWRENAEAWFDFWDINNDGELDRTEVARALAISLKNAGHKVSLEGISKILKGMWVLFDPSGNGGIDKQEFAQPDGLRDTLLAEEEALMTQPADSPSASAPANDIACFGLPHPWRREHREDGLFFVNMETGATQREKPVEEHKRPNGYDF